MPLKNKPLSNAELTKYETTRDLAAELLQSVRQMKAGHVHVVSSRQLNPQALVDALALRDVQK